MQTTSCPNPSAQSVCWRVQNPTANLSSGAAKPPLDKLESAGDYAIFSLRLRQRVTSWNLDAEAVVKIQSGRHDPEAC